MNYLTLSIGSSATLIGLALVVLTFIYLRENRVKTILVGIVFAILGAFILWSGFQGSDTIQINIGISDRQISFFLVSFVASLFIVKGVLDIREGSKNLQSKSVSSFLIFKRKFQIIVALIVTGWAVLVLVMNFTQFGK